MKNWRQFDLYDNKLSNCLLSPRSRSLTHRIYYKFIFPLIVNVTNEHARISAVIVEILIAFSLNLSFL